MSTALATPQVTSGDRPMRVVVLDDDPVFRAVLGRMLTRQGLEVVATCADIASAQRRVSRGDVEAVTVDVVLKGESGLDFLKWCRSQFPKVINVLVTAGSERGARTGIDGILLGAATLLTKPDAARLAGFESELKRVFDDGRPKSKLSRPLMSATGPFLKKVARRDLLAIGASTGGPPALLKLLKGLPPHFDAPVVITQHMPALHLEHFADLLTSQSGRRVELVKANVQLERGKMYLAGGDRHLQVMRVAGTLQARPLDTPPEHHCRPAVDPMFNSVAQACAGTALAVVLTGMGSDGARGAVTLRQRGNPVLVQDEASSVVWGMPSATMNAGAADAVVPIDRLPTAILEWMDWTSRGNNP